MILLRLIILLLLFGVVRVRLFIFRQIGFFIGRFHGLRVHLIIIVRGHLDVLRLMVHDIQRRVRVLRQARGFFVGRRVFWLILRNRLGLGLLVLVESRVVPNRVDLDRLVQLEARAQVVHLHHVQLDQIFVDVDARVVQHVDREGLLQEERTPELGSLILDEYVISFELELPVVP